MDNENQDVQPTAPKTSQSTQEPKLPTTEESQQEASKKDKKIPKVAIYVLASIILLAFGAFGFWLYQNKIAKLSFVQPPSSQVPTKTFEPSPEVVQPFQVKATYETVTKVNPQDESKTDVYIKKSDTGEEIFLMTLTDVYRQHVHNSEYHNGNLYIIRRIGYDGYPDDEWSDELWKYDSRQNGKKLFSSQGLLFLVSPNEEMIGIKSGEKVFLIDTGGRQIKQFSSEELDFNPSDMANGLDILEWSSGSQTLWGWHTFGPVPASYFEIDINSWQIRKYDISALSFGTEGDLNTETRKIVYSDYPALFDVDSAEDFKANEKKVTLYLYDFITKENKEIATSIVKPFKPEWLDRNSFEYDNPDGEGRLVHSL